VGERWTRRTTLLLAVLVAGAVASLRWTVHDVFLPELDAALYLRTAQALLRGEGYTYLGVPFELRPPGFPVLLTPVLAVAGLDFGAINAWISLWGVAAVALYFAWLRGRFGDLLSFALAAWLWLNPQFRTLGNSVMSDVPGVAFLLAALLAERRSRTRPGIRGDIVTGAAVAAAAYVRSAAILLLPAIVLSRLAAGRPGRAGARRMLLLCSVAAVLLLPWGIRNRLHEQPAPADQTWLYSQWVAMWHADRGDPASPLLSGGELRHRVAKQARWIVSGVGHRLRASAPDPRHAAFGLVGLAALVAVAWRRRGTADLWALGSTVLLLFWHAAPDRLLLPVLIFAGPAVVDVLRGPASRAMGERAVRVALATVVLATAALDARDGSDWGAAEAEDRAQRESAAALEAHLRDGDVLATTVRPWLDAVYLDRPVVNLRPAMQRGGAAEVDAVLDRYGVNVVLLRSGTPSPVRESVARRYECRALGPGLTLCRREAAGDPAPGAAR